MPIEIENLWEEKTPKLSELTQEMVANFSKKLEKNSEVPSKAPTLKVKEQDEARKKARAASSPQSYGNPFSALAKGKERSTRTVFFNSEPVT